MLSVGGVALWALLLVRGASGSCVEGCNGSWLESVGRSERVPASHEYLPAPSVSTAWYGPCSEELARALVREAIAGSTEVDSAAMHYNPDDTIGKFVHIATTSLLGPVVRGAAYSLRAPVQKKEDNKWASRVACGGQTEAWACLFGSTPRAPGSVPACRRVWEARATDATRDSAAITLFEGIIAAAVAPLPLADRHAVRLRVDHNVPSGSGEYILVHVRRGDACEFWLEERLPYQDIFWQVFGRRPCFRWPVYEKELHRMTELYGFQNVAVVSEGGDAVEEARRALSASHNVMWLDYDRSRLGFGSGWIENRKDTDAATVYSALAALSLGKNASAIVGHFYSHFTKSIYLLNSGFRGVPPPWISVDGGGVRPWALRDEPPVDALSNIMFY
jgi:hypothetical protein